MRSQHRRTKIFFIVFSLIAITVIRIFIWHSSDIIPNIISTIDNATSNAPVCETMIELTNCIDENLLAKNKEITVRLGGSLTPDSILNINQYVNPCWGTCTEYYEKAGLTSQSMPEVELSLELTDEVYVYDAIHNGSDISEAPETAQKLYHRVQNIINTKINSSMSDYQKELTFYKYLLDICEYNKGHLEECRCSSKSSDEAESEPLDPSHTAYGALVEGSPVCSGYARAMNLLLACEGIQTKIVYGTGESEEHSWNLIQLDDKWYHLDATWDDNGLSKKSSFYYFNITDDMIYGSHMWDQNMYPEATGKKYNYYRMNKRYFTSKKKFKKQMRQALVNDGKKTYTALLDNICIKDRDMDILFRGNTDVSSIRWNMIEDNQKYAVIKVITG